jgi:putative Holliday junction resolvase
MECGRILAVDYGVKNVGLACCDELGVAVRPLPSVPNNGRRELIGRLRSAVQEHGIERLVVGLPLNMDGSSGEAVRRVERFMEALRAELSLPLCGFDERLSTTEATEIWRGMGSRQQKKYRTVDSLAAAIILERYLEES